MTDEERKIIVWLRLNEARHMRSSTDTTRARELTALAMAGAYGYAADAIERGEHRSPPSPSRDTP